MRGAGHEVRYLAAGRPSPLANRVAVLSPHCDDAVLSLGASIWEHTRRGGTATIVTAMAGDPRCPAESGPWDRAAGFTTAGAAAGARQREDITACRLLGADLRHVPEVDEQYPRRLDDAELSASLLEQLEPADEVLLPGFPLWHGDHRLVSDMVLEALPGSRTVRLYVEEPYGIRERLADVPARSRVPAPVRWGPVPASRRGVLRKLRAARCYRSQLPLLCDPSPHQRLGTSPTVLLLELARTALARGEWVTEPVAAGRLREALMGESSGG